MRTTANGAISSFDFGGFWCRFLLSLSRVRCPLGPLARAVAAAISSAILVPGLANNE